MHAAQREHIATVMQVADLGVQKYGVTTGDVNAGDVLTYVIIATNYGPGVAYGVALTDTLSSDGAYNVTSITGAACAPGVGGYSGVMVFTCGVGALAPNAEQVITFTMTALDDQTINNVARVSHNGEDPVASNNTASAQNRVRPVAEGESLPESLTPVYPTTAGLAQSALRKLIGGALRHHPPREDLPDEVVRRLDLMALPDALHLLHAPPPSLALVDIEDRGHPAWQRIKLDELLAQQISLRRAYAARRAKNAPGLPLQDTLTRQLLGQLPFALTGAPGGGKSGSVAFPCRDLPAV